MMKMKVFGILVSTMFLLPVTVVAQFTPKSGEDPMKIWLNDPISATLRAYTEAADEVRGNPSPAVKLAHYQEWKERFQKAIDDGSSPVSD